MIHDYTKERSYIDALPYTWCSCRFCRMQLPVGTGPNSMHLTHICLEMLTDVLRAGDYFNAVLEKDVSDLSKFVV
jgi:hypothetical protein